MAPEAVAAWFGVGGPTAGAEAPGAQAPGGMPVNDSAWVGLTAGIHRAVPGVAGNPLETLQQPVNVQDSVVAGANDAFDKLHGGNWNGQLEQQVRLGSTTMWPSAYLVWPTLPGRALGSHANWAPFCSGARLRNLLL